MPQCEEVPREVCDVVTTQRCITVPQEVEKEVNYIPITNERENVHSKFLLMKSSKKYFIFSFACYLIIWLMISPKIFEKKAF